MAALPQLLEEDADVINAALGEFLERSEATSAMIAAEGGFLVYEAGRAGSFDTTTVAALAANSFVATQAIAQLIKDPGFKSLYQQGESSSLWIGEIDDSSLLIVVFPAECSVGVVRYFGLELISVVSRQLAKARRRAPTVSVDLAMLNLADSTELFRRKATPQ